MKGPPDDRRAGETVALVLPGGGARGAYEAGALSILLPALEARGERVAIVCGTSVGAINATLLGSVAHRSAQEQGDALVSRWESVHKDEVFCRLISPRLPLTALRLLGEAVGLPGMNLTNLLDSTPLRHSLGRWVDWEALAQNVERRCLDSVAVVATSLAHGRPVAFVQGRGPAARAAEGDEITYVPALLSPEHVSASAALPVLFPPVHVGSPSWAAGWYTDGATRLNSPLKPALALGADRVIVIAFEPLRRRAVPPHEAHSPHLADVLANVLDGLLVDQVVEDLRRLATINAFFIEDAATGGSRAARAYRTSRGRTPYRKVSYAVVAPAEHGAIGRMADELLARRYGGLRGLRELDFALLGRLAGGHGSVRGELLSFLLFDTDFARVLIDAGQADARRWLDRHPRFWCSDPAHDLGVVTGDPRLQREDRAIEEWRALRRR